MRIFRLRGLLLWELGGYVFEWPHRSLSISLVRAPFWSFGIKRFSRLTEVFVGPIAFVYYTAAFYPEA